MKNEITKNLSYYSFLPYNKRASNIWKKLKEDQLNLFLYRRKTLPKSQIRTELALMAKVCLEEQIYLILNSHHVGESVNKFSGIHLTSVDSRKENSRYITGDNLLGISCHSEEDIMKAESLKADYIFFITNKRN